MRETAPFDISAVTFCAVTIAENKASRSWNILFYPSMSGRLGISVPKGFASTKEKRVGTKGGKDQD